MSCCCWGLSLIDEPMIELEFITESGGGPPYAGPYLVIPQAYNPQYLLTNGKTMTDDVTVTEIPYAEVSNTFGTTVIIAS